jgi:hypothetical protein
MVRIMLKKTDSGSAGQQFRDVLFNPNVQCHVHSSLPHATILSHTNQSAPSVLIPSQSIL